MSYHLRTMETLKAIAFKGSALQDPTLLAGLEFSRPLIRFDGGAGDNCYPDEASNANNGHCAPFRQDAPIYYKIVRCGDFLKLAWHLWYGLQRGCDPFGLDGGHDDDWEHVTINFIRSGDSWVQDSVTFSQHGGFYTRQITQQVELILNTKALRLGILLASS